MIFARVYMSIGLYELFDDVMQLPLYVAKATFEESL